MYPTALWSFPSDIHILHVCSSHIWSRVVFAFFLPAATLSMYITIGCFLVILERRITGRTTTLGRMWTPVLEWRQDSLLVAAAGTVARWCLTGEAGLIGSAAHTRLTTSPVSVSILSRCISSSEESVQNLTSLTDFSSQEIWSILVVYNL